MSTQALVDIDARRTALVAHDRTLLVEAGAGSGKTAVLAGRIAMLLIQGVEPSAIAAVKEEVRVGIADAIAFSDDGIPDVVIDWKSDVAPSPDAVAHYKAQVRAYLAMTGTPKGLIVFATSGAVHPVTLTAA